MTRKERRRLLDPERKLAFGEELSALLAKYGYRRTSTFTGVMVAKDGEPPQRFAIDRDGDLTDPTLAGWDEDDIARGRSDYEYRVASGYFDSKDDAKDDEDEALKATPKLTLPLYDGQRIVTGGGKVGVVGKGSASDIVQVSDGIGALWRDIGKKNRDKRHWGPHDAVADAPADGWIDHDPLKDDCPEAARDARVVVRLRDGDEQSSRRFGKSWNWTATANHDRQIVAWKMQD